jgi:hypothetical protein
LDLPNLSYIAETGKTEPLPRWAQFFLDLGASIAAHEPQPHRVIVGLSVPTKTYASILAASGAIICLAQIRPLSDEQIQRHIDKLCMLTKGTPVTFRTLANYQKKGLFLGCETLEGQLYVCIALGAKGKHITKLPAAKATGIEPLEAGSFALRDSQRVWKIVSDEEFMFLKHLLGIEQAGMHLASSRLECNIVGTISSVRSDLSATTFSVTRSPSQSVQGNLDTLLRIRALQPESATYHTDVVSSMTQPPSNVSEQSNTTLTIFSGALGFLKWRHLYRRSNWLVVLDRTEPRYVEATAELNQEYVHRRSDAPFPVPLPPMPGGIESICYLEELQ